MFTATEDYNLSPLMIKTHEAGEIRISVNTLIVAFLIIILFDGIFRLVADIYRLRVINAWKDGLIFIFLYTLIFYLVLIRRKVILSRWDSVFIIFSLLVVPVGLFYHGVIQTAAGIKIFLIPILFNMLFFNVYEPSKPSFELFKKFLIVNLIVYIPIFLYALLQYTTKFSFLTWFSINPWDVSYIKVTLIGSTFRAIGTFRNQFNYGNYSAFIAIFSFEGVILSKRLSSKIFFFVFFLIAFIGVFISTSRSSLLITLYVMIALVLITYFRRFKNLIKFVLLIMSIALPIFIMYIALFKLFGGGQKFFMFSTLSTVSRLFVWWDAITNFPFFKSPITLLFGYGIGAIGGAQALVGDPHWNPVDNIFLYFLINFGLVGTVMILYLLLQPIFFYINRIDRIEPNWLDVIVALTLAIVFAEGMFATFFDGFPLPYIFWFMHFFFRLKSRELLKEQIV